MKILEFMQKKNYRAENIASEIGVTSAIVKLWMQGKSSPRLIHAIRLNKLSGGKIKLEEMLSLDDVNKLK